MYRTFSTLEEALETWKREAEKKPKSGILCECHCYRWDDDIKQSSPIRECTLLLPQEQYQEYEQDTRKKDREHDSKKHIVVLHPGIIRVRFYQKERENYLTKERLCKESTKVKALLRKYLGQKIRLGRNLRVK